MSPLTLPFIQSHELFGSLSPTNQERLARGVRVRVMEPGELVFAQGDKGTACYGLVFGSIKVHQVSPDGRDVLIKILEKGELFGEVILFDDIPYPANAVALEPSTVLEVARDLFFSLLDDGGFRDDFIKIILAKLRFLNGKVHNLMTLDVEERFFSYVFATWGRGPSYQVDISKKDFALAIGTVPETFSRLLTRLKERGEITWEGRSLVLAPKVLVRYHQKHQG